MSRDVDHFVRFTRLLELERQAERSRLALEKQTLPAGRARGPRAGGARRRDHRRIDRARRPLPHHLHARVEAAPEHAAGPRRSRSPSPRARPRSTRRPRAPWSRATRASVVVAFDRPPPPWMGEGRLRLDVTANDVTFDRAKSALTKWQAMDSGQKRDRREILLGNLAPRFDKPPAFTPHRAAQPRAARGRVPGALGPRRGAGPRAAGHRQVHRALRARRAVGRPGQAHPLHGGQQRGGRSPARALPRGGAERGARGPPGARAAAPAGAHPRSAGGGAPRSQARPRALRRGLRSARLRAQAAHPRPQPGSLRQRPRGERRGLQADGRRPGARAQGAQLHPRATPRWCAPRSRCWRARCCARSSSTWRCSTRRPRPSSRSRCWPSSRRRWW